jgi:hypothetical protein
MTGPYCVGGKSSVSPKPSEYLDDLQNIPGWKFRKGSA